MLAYRILGLAARLLLALGVVCILLGGYLLWRTQALAGDVVRVNGTVVSYREIGEGDETRYRPRIRFTTEGGDIVSFDGQLATTTRRFAVGEQVPVVYPRSDTRQARLASFADNWLGVVAATAIGLLCLVAGIFIRRATRRGIGGNVLGGP
jgi:hypothetical protein